MRTISPFRLLLVPVALLAAACDDSPDPTAPNAPPAAEAEPHGPGSTGPLEDLAYWADGYLYAHAPTSSSYTPMSLTAWSRSGMPINITKVPGTTGRYVVRFSGLSALVGAKNTVRVTAAGLPDAASYCKPVGAFLVRDSVEVRCYRIGTGAPQNSEYYVQVLAKRDDRAAAFANQPSAASYTPASSGSYNTAGTTKVIRSAVGRYQVVFGGFGTRLPAGTAGHVQVNAAGTGKGNCKVVTYGGSPDVTVDVACFSASGYSMDSKFSALLTMPAAHLAYAWIDSPSYTQPYSAYRVYASNPIGGTITIKRSGLGAYEVRWAAVDAEIRDYGTMAVTAWGESGTHCYSTALGHEYAQVQCRAVNGLPSDEQFVVLLGS